MHVAGLVLARGGSKGIPLKNLALLNGEPLLVWALKAMSGCKGLSSIWVSSDNEDILAVAEKNGAGIHHRSATTSSDAASSLDAILEFLSTHSEVDVVALVQCTSPFIQVSDLDEACEKMESGFDSVFSVTRSHALRWAEDDSGNFEASNFNPKCRPKRQDWKGDLIENGAFYFTKVNLLHEGFIQAGRISFVETNQHLSIDIDTPYDLWLAEQHAIYFRLEPGGNVNEKIHKN